MSRLFFAYLDPTSGSIAYQVAISGLLAAGAAVRLYWSRIKSVFSRGESQPNCSQDRHKCDSGSPPVS